MSTRYQVLRAGGVRDLDLAVDVPFDPSSAAWNEYRAWTKLGNVPLDPDPEVIPPPTAEEAAALARLLDDQTATDTAKLNPIIQYLVTHTPAECAAKVQADVTSLATAKTMLAHFAVALCVLARGKLR